MRGTGGKKEAKINPAKRGMIERREDRGKGGITELTKDWGVKDRRQSSRENSIRWTGIGTHLIELGKDGNDEDRRD